ncbi:unnamed protein product [Musa hybrid cultivar]
MASFWWWWWWSQGNLCFRPQRIADHGMSSLFSANVARPCLVHTESMLQEQLQEECMKPTTMPVSGKETMNIKKENPAKLKQISQVHPTCQWKTIVITCSHSFSGLEMFRLSFPSLFE